MPKPVFKTLSNTTVPDVAMPDPTAKVNKVFEAKTASETKPLPKKADKKEDKNTNQAIPTELSPVSDEDAGW